MRKGVGFVFVEGPLDFFEEHAVHWWDGGGGHVDEAFGEDEAYLWGRAAGRACACACGY